MSKVRWRIIAEIALFGIMLFIVFSQSGQLDQQSKQLKQLTTEISVTGAANHTETLNRINSILAYDRQTRQLLQAYADPKGTYRQAIDAMLCAELRDTRAIAQRDGIPLGPLLNPPNARGYVVVGGVCRVAVLP